MTLAALLSLLSAALSFVALVFFAVGLARTIPAAWWRSRSVDGEDAQRLRIAQRAEWQCAAGLIGVALVAVVASWLGTGPAFTEPSGNVAGGVLLIALLVSGVVLVTLFFRHVIVSHALRKLNVSDQRSNRE